MARVRLDEELVRQGLFPDVDSAYRSVLAGEVSTTSRRLDSPGEQVAPGIELHVRGRRSYVSRGGTKLEHGLDAFGVSPEGLACLDIGCSTGGFTHCLLTRGAASVVAVDVGYAQFDWGLRQDGRVELLERTNVVDIATPERAGTIELAVCDVSFTSISNIVDAVVELLAPGGRFLTLVKPQFEAAREQVGQGGVVRDASVWREVLVRCSSQLAEAGLAPGACCASPIAGAKGNREFLMLAELGGESQDLVRDIDAAIAEASA